jgi:hypothetical protein
MEHGSRSALADGSQSFDHEGPTMRMSFSRECTNRPDQHILAYNVLYSTEPQEASPRADPCYSDFRIPHPRNSRVTQLVLPRPLSHAIEVPALVMRTEIRSGSLRRCRVIDDQIRRRVGMAHQADTQRLDTVVNMHASTHVSRSHVRGSLDDVGVSEVPVAPCVLADQVLCVSCQ